MPVRKIGVMSEPVEFDEVVVKKHIKLKSKLGQIDVHCSDNTVGVWLSKAENDADSCVAAAYVCKRNGPVIAIYPDKKTFKAKNTLPFAISGHGLQVPHVDGTVTHLSFAEISDIVKTYHKIYNVMKSSAVDAPGCCDSEKDGI